jgi:hypothetical protein
MGSRKNKRRRQARPREGAKVKNQSQSAATPKPPFWQRSHKLLWTILGALAILGTLIEIYPWLSIEEDALLDPHNPFSELFVVTNEGYIPVTDLDALCTGNGSVSARGNTFANIRREDRRFADYLGKGGRVTAPCFRLMHGISPDSGATLDIKITYAFYHLNLSLLRRSQTFYFKSIIGDDGAQHWQFLGK